MPRDIDKLVHLAEEMHRNSRYKHLEFSKKKVFTLFIHGLKNGILVGFVDEKNEEVVGSIIGFVDSYFFCNINFLVGYGMYVLPEHRKSKSASKLLRSFVDAGTKIGMNEISMDDLNEEHQDLLEPIYEKIGFKKVGHIYRINCDDNKLNAAAA